MQKRIDPSNLDLKESIVNIRRVTKVVKGGKNFRFSVTVVVGDGAGHVGLGLGKSQEIPEAVRKAVEDAKKDLIMPAAPGTGVIAGGSARTVLEYAGLKDVKAKSLGSSNAGNVAYATIEGLRALKTIEQVSRLRGKTKEEILG